MSPVRTVTHVSGTDQKKMVGARGFEPPTARTPSVCASQAALRPDEKVFFKRPPVYQIFSPLSLILTTAAPYDKMPAAKSAMI